MNYRIKEDIILKYCSDDGKHVFDSEEEYHAWLTAERDKKFAKDKLAKEKKARADEIAMLSEQVKTKVEAYKKDYGEYPNKVYICSNEKKDVMDISKEFDNIFGSKRLRFFG
jgi:hypothetical protein